MQRRELLRAAGAATALAILPHADAVAAWARIGAGFRPAAGLSAAHLALVGRIADTILPRTDTPSATDVGVPAFVDVIVSENYSDEERAAFAAGLDRVGQSTVAALEAMRDRRAEPARTYWRLKGLAIHGYFTSEPVMKQVLHTQIAPGKFDGAAPMPHA